MKVKLHPTAVADIESIFARIETDSPRAAATVVDRILESIDRLGELPRIGRRGREPGTREWVIPRLPYIVVYEIDDAADALWVLAVFHGAEDRPDDR